MNRIFNTWGYRFIAAPSINRSANQRTTFRTMTLMPRVRHHQGACIVVHWVFPHERPYLLVGVLHVWPNGFLFIIMNFLKKGARTFEIMEFSHNKSLKKGRS